MGVSNLSRSLVRHSMRRVRRSLYPGFLDLAQSWAGKLSEEQCERWARRMGAFAFSLLLPERRKVFSHLRMAYGEALSPDEMTAIGVSSFQGLALSGLECLRFRGLEPRKIMERVQIEGWEHVEAAHRAGLGGIFVTGHLGNWELCAVYVAIRGIPMNVVARRIYLEPLNQRLVTIREGMGVRTLYRDESMRAMIRRLRENEFLGILPDQDVRRIGGIFVDFFGRPAHTPVGPALLCLASGSPLLLARDIREGSRHRITVDPPVWADRSAPREEEVRRLVNLYSQRLEQFVREHPEQWVWMHRRWRTRPPV